MTWICGCSDPRPDGCPACRPVTAPIADLPGFGKATPIAAHGCVCPAGAEVTCRGDLCPRRPMSERAS